MPLNREDRIARADDGDGFAAVGDDTHLDIVVIEMRRERHGDRAIAGGGFGARHRRYSRNAVLPTNETLVGSSRRLIRRTSGAAPRGSASAPGRGSIGTSRCRLSGPIA